MVDVPQIIQQISNVPYTCSPVYWRTWKVICKRTAGYLSGGSNITFVFAEHWTSTGLSSSIILNKVQEQEEMALSRDITSSPADLILKNHSQNTANNV